MQDNDIINAVLVHLQGYIVESEETISDLDYDKKVSSEEVLSFYRISTNYALSYMNRRTIPTITIVEEETEIEVPDPVALDGIAMWTAGKLWQKYNVRVKNNEDETNVLGYGDKLVIQAKELLKPFKYYKMNVY